MRLLGRRWRHPALTELHFVLFSMLRHFVPFSTLRHFVPFSTLRHFVPFSTLRVKTRVEAMV
jgi:hypothetical protein